MPKNIDDEHLRKNELLTKEGKVPLDLAFCRWLAVECGVMLMPNSIFYHKESEFMNDNFVRIAICRGEEETKRAIS